MLFRIVLNLYFNLRNRMKFYRNSFVIKFLSLVSLSILLLSIVNRSLYLHSHELENGEIVTHAHPFDQQEDNNPLKSHKHTTLEYLVFSAFDIFTTSILLFTIVTFIAIAAIKKYALKTLVKQFYFHCRKNKSPPILNSI